MKVLTVGCSFTYGEELAHPQADSWPVVLARKNFWELNNQGKCGGSNDRSTRVVFEEIDKGYDLIIVAWTVPDRFEVPANGTVLDININSGEKRNMYWATEYYAKHYDRLYSYTKWLRNVILLQSYLKSRNQRYLFCSTFGMWSDLGIDTYQEYSKNLDWLIKQVDKEHYVDWPEWGMTDWMGNCPKGPGGHPLEAGHTSIAVRINEHIRHLGWLS